jgi:hypothetical protein
MGNGNKVKKYHDILGGKWFALDVQEIIYFYKVTNNCRIS